MQRARHDGRRPTASPVFHENARGQERTGEREHECRLVGEHGIVRNRQQRGIERQDTEHMLGQRKCRRRRVENIGVEEPTGSRRESVYVPRKNPHREVDVGT